MISPFLIWIFRNFVARLQVESLHAENFHLKARLRNLSLFANHIFLKAVACVFLNSANDQLVSTFHFRQALM